MNTPVLLAACAAVHAQIQLQPVVTGLTSPVFVTHAGDGTNRLFILEKAGVMKVLQAGASTPTVFLDITSLVSSLDERGLLGLAFHPSYPVNGRFFIYYTRASDGAIQISEYHVSASDPNTADPTETPILTIPHPTYANHNSGMIAFGPDGFLYAGTGDGGLEGDPSNNAQNTSVLLGKMLRIDIDHPSGSVPYSSPPDNPFAGSSSAAPEIYALGLRNPWRWSFDRGGTHQLFCGEVGAASWEEVDAITLGGNYGWRVYEGFQCTGADQNLCVPANFIFPLIVYGHTLSRCGIIGGYVYRGTRSTLPAGAYVYGDLCTGEIFQLDPPSSGGAQTVLLHTGLSLASFGEDESGELYLADLAGTIQLLTASAAPAACAYSISPATASISATGGSQSFTVTTTGDCSWVAASSVDWITITAGASGTGSNTVTLQVTANTGADRTGTIQVGGQTFTLTQSTATPGTAGPNPCDPATGNCGSTGQPATPANPPAGTDAQAAADSQTAAPPPWWATLCGTGSGAAALWITLGLVGLRRIWAPRGQRHCLSPGAKGT